MMCSIKGRVLIRKGRRRLRSRLTDIVMHDSMAVLRDDVSDVEGFSSKEREDLEQQLVRNHRHRRRIIDQRSNHRHRGHCALHPSRCISMTIWSPCERVGKPLIGSNHMHSMACREGDETSMLVERSGIRILGAAIEG